ncbi:PstS family phosphate ABC transporter substrate-binding protein [Chloroflexota bacterium]
MNTNKIIKWLTIPLSAILLFAIALTGCSGGATSSDSFSIVGSNTVTPLTSIWAEDFIALRPDISIAVSGPGSGAGIASLINGTTDICQASRSIKDSEVAAAQANGVNPYEIPVAIDALSVVVNPANSVSELTIAQLSAIYTNQITNWQDVGGNDAPIVAIARDTNSGTHVYFKEQVVQMKGLDSADKSLEYGPYVLMLPSTKEGAEEVANNANAIFYPGLGYLTDEVKPLAIKNTADDPGVLPTMATALDGSYPIARPLLYYTNGEPAGIIKEYIDYCLSSEGQQKVTDAGYVPLP